MFALFSNFVPELVSRIFVLFSSRKLGWNFSYEPKWSRYRANPFNRAPVKSPKSFAKFSMCSCERVGWNAGGHQGENERQWKKKLYRNTYNISSIRLVTRKFLEISRSSRTKQRNVSLALHDFIFCLSKVQILKRASLLALAKSIYYNVNWSFFFVLHNNY